jgi:hypothetical protein
MLASSNHFFCVACRVSGLTPQQFFERYELTSTPVVLADGAMDWPALQKWSMEYLRQAYGERPVIAGARICYNPCTGSFALTTLAKFCALTSNGLVQ